MVVTLLGICNNDYRVVMNILRVYLVVNIFVLSVNTNYLYAPWS